MMQAYLNFYRARLEAFRTGELVDVSALAAPIFEQPVAFTRELVRHIVPEHREWTGADRLFMTKLVEAAHRELVDTTGSRSASEPVTVDFASYGWAGLRVIFCFVRDPGTDTSLPVVTVGFRTDFEDDG